MTDHPPLPTDTEWAALCAAADQRPRGKRLSVVALLARIRELEEALAEYGRHKQTCLLRCYPCLCGWDTARAALAPGPGADAAAHRPAAPPD